MYKQLLPFAFPI